MSELLFVPVPGGVRTDGTSILRVVVVPRLDSGTLADNGLTSWPPAELRNPLPVTLTPDGTAATTIEITPRLSDQDGLWSQVFGKATVAAPVQRDLTADPMSMTLSSQNIGNVQDSYQAVTRAYNTAMATDPATAMTAFTDAVGEQVSSTVWAPPKPTPPPIVTPQPAPLDGPPPVPPTDVNRIYGTLREHPHVLAALGLILELDLPVGSVPPGTAGLVRVDWPAAESVLPALPRVTPRNAAYLADVFLPAPHVDDQHPVSDLDAGVVRLDDASRWMLAAVDAEAAVLRMQAAHTSGPNPNTSRGDATTPTVTVSLPALRTAGITLVRPGRDEDFAYRRARSLTVAGDDEPTLYAEDLVLGYRIDVRTDDDPQWRALCARQVAYRINDTVVGTAGDMEEGHIKAHAAHRDDTQQLMADEVVTRWDGWSLAVPRPFPLHDAGSQYDDASGIDSSALPYLLTADFTVPPGSLPPLRFGSTYRLRARVADIAGGGLGIDDPAAGTHESAAFQFLRHEPVSAPALLLPDGAVQGQLGAGVHAANLVITSEGGAGVTAPPDAASPAQSRRSLARPAVSLTTAEWHGAIAGDADATWPIAQRAIADGHLPDPIATGLAAAVVPEPGGPTANPVMQLWPDWPDTTGTAIQLHPRAADSDPLLAWDSGTLTVTLAPAEDVAVQVSSTVSAGDVDLLAVSAWADSDTPGVAAGQTAMTAATIGEHPMVTPQTTLRCVHAVRRPLADPTGQLIVARDAGTVPVTITPTVPLFGVDPASTGQVDITAAWTEVTDDLRLPATNIPVRTGLTASPVQSVTVHRGDTDFAQPIQHDLPDTRYRQITYTVTAVSRFRDYFADSPDDACASQSLTSTVDVPSTNPPAPPKVAAVVPTFVWEQTLGPLITRTRRGNRIRVELERPWFDSGDGEQLVLVLALPDVASFQPPATQVGKDPMYDTPAPIRYPVAEACVGSGGPPVQITGSSPWPFEVVPSDVLYDAAAARWYADFDLSGVPGETYMPLVRPALARYQRHSLPGCELSPLVLADFVPLLPDRTLTVRVDAAADGSTTVTVTLAGTGPDGSTANQVNAVIERGGANEHLVATAANMGSGSWYAPQQSVQRAVLGEPMVFTVPVAAGASLAGSRVRVREIELAPFDRNVPDPGVPEVMGTLDELGWRTVFVDAVPLEWSQQAGSGTA